MDTAEATQKYQYYISYSHQAGFGATAINCSAPLRSWDDVEVIRQFVMRNNPQLGNVVIVNWTLLNPGTNSFAELYTAISLLRRTAAKDMLSDKPSDEIVTSILHRLEQLLEPTMQSSRRQS